MFGRKIRAELERARSLAVRLEQQNARWEHVARSEVIPLLESYDCECSDDDGMCGRCYATGLLDELLVSPAFSDRVEQVMWQTIFGTRLTPTRFIGLSSESLEWAPGTAMTVDKVFTEIAGNLS